MTRQEKKEELIGLFSTGAIFIGDLIDECFEFGQQHPNWISVEDELPPRGRTDPYVSVPVITCKIVNRGLHEIGFQRYIFGNGKWEYCDATHWMPLPPAPKKGGEE